MGGEFSKPGDDDYVNNTNKSGATNFLNQITLEPKDAYDMPDKHVKLNSKCYEHADILVACKKSEVKKCPDYIENADCAYYILRSDKVAENQFEHNWTGPKKTNKFLPYVVNIDNDHELASIVVSIDFGSTEEKCPVNFDENAARNELSRRPPTSLYTTSISAPKTCRNLKHFYYF